MGLFKSKKAQSHDSFEPIEDWVKFRPYYIIDGKLTKNHPFSCLWENYIPFLNGLEGGISKKTLEQIIKQERLDTIPDGEGYGGYRTIVFTERETIGRAWTLATFPCRVVIDNSPKNLFVVTATGERGREGERCYFTSEDEALTYFCAWLRYMKNKQ